MSTPLVSGGGVSNPSAPPQRLEHFEVVMMKSGGPGAHAAKPEDFKRVPVQAADPMNAQFSDEVDAAKKAGFDFVMVAKPGQETEPEMQARHRELSGSHRLDKREVAWK